MLKLAPDLDHPEMQIELDERDDLASVWLPVHDNPSPCRTIAVTLVPHLW